MRYLSFNTIAKRCPNGTWLDEKSGKCVSHEEWYKLNTKNRSDNANGEKKKRCPKGQWMDDKTGECVSHEEWKKRNYKNYKPKTEEEFKPRDKITPYTDGVPKAPILQITRGFVRSEIKERFSEQFGQADELKETLMAFTDGTMGDVEDSSVFESSMRKSLKPSGISTTRLDEMDPRGYTVIAQDVSDAISEFPIGLMGFNGLELDEDDCGSTIMYYAPKDQTIHYNPRYFKTGGTEIDGKTYDVLTKAEYKKAYDPVLKKVSDKWSFHPEGSVYGQSFSHEYGHGIADMLMRGHSRIREYYKNNPDKLPEDYKKRKEEYENKKNEFIDEFNEYAKELGFKDPYTYIISVDGSVYTNLSIKESDLEWSDDRQEYVLSSYNPMYDKLLTYMEKKGFKRERKKLDLTYVGQNIDGEDEYTIKLSYKDPKERLVFNELPPAPSIEDMMKEDESLKDFFQSKREFDISEEYQGQIIEQCESLYKEIYGVKEIIPSDVYSGYAYFGPEQSFGESPTYISDIHEVKRGPRKGHYDIEEKKKTPIDIAEKRYTIRNTIAGERIAEAFSDVIVRKDKANSMSVLIVSAVEYEFYKMMSGKTESFSDFIRANYDFKESGTPITKSTRYMLFI